MGMQFHIRACQQAKIPLLLTVMLSLTACQHRPPTPSPHHLSPPVHPSPTVLSTPDIKPSLPSLVEPAPKTFSLVVSQAPARDVLTQIAKEAGLNADVHPAINGLITIHAVKQSLPAILNRIAQQVAIRWRMSDQAIIIEPDTPYLKHYQINHLNLNRQYKTEIGASSVVKASGSHSIIPGNQSGHKAGSYSQFQNEAHNHFWQSLQNHLEKILQERSLPPTVVDSTPKSNEQKSNQHIATIQSKDSFSQTSNLVSIHKETGIVSILATENQHQKISQLIKEIELQSNKQVMIEATIIEIELSHEYQMGIDWQGIFQEGRYRYQQNFARYINSSPIPKFNAALPVFEYISRNGNIQSTIQALESFGKLKVLSSPKIISLNNQPAILKAVQDIPYFTMRVNISEGNNNQVSRTSYESNLNTVSEGIVLTILPQISDQGKIAINIRPTISSVIGYIRDPAIDLALSQQAKTHSVDVKSEIPIVQIRELESTLFLQDGQVAVLGGLIKDQIKENNIGLPFISRLPVLGNVFKYQTEETKKTELVVLIKPTLISKPHPNLLNGG